MVSRQDRTQRLVAACVKSHITPRKNSFADFIRQLTATYFSLTRATGKGYTNVLIQAWGFDQWRSLVKSNPHLSLEEKQQWIKKF